MLEQLNTEDAKKKLKNTQYVKGIGLIDTDKFLLEVRRDLIQKEEERNKHLVKQIDNDSAYIDHSDIDPEKPAANYTYSRGFGQNIPTLGDVGKEGPVGKTLGIIKESPESFLKGIGAGSYYLTAEGLGETFIMASLPRFDANLYLSGVKLSDYGVEGQKELEASSDNKIAFQLGQGAGTILTSAALTTLGAVTGGTTGAIGLGFLSSAIIEGGTAHRTAREYGLDANDAQAVGLTIGLVNGALEFLPILRGLKKIPGFKKLLTEVSEEVTGKVLERGLFKTIVKEAGIQAGVEGGQEALQEITNLTAETLYKKLGDRPQWAEWRDRISQSAIYGAVLGGLFSGLGSISTYKFAQNQATQQKKQEELEGTLKKQIDEYNKTVEDSQKISTGVEASIISGLGTIPIDLSKSSIDKEKIKAAKEKAEKSFPRILGLRMKLAQDSKEPVSLTEIMYKTGEQLLDSFFSNLNASLSEEERIASINPKDGNFRVLSNAKQREILQKLTGNLITSPAFNNSKLSKKISEYADGVLKNDVSEEIKQAFINDMITSLSFSPVNLKGNAKNFKLKTVLKTYIATKYKEALKTEKVIGRAYREGTPGEDLGVLAQEAVALLTPKIGKAAAEEQATTMGREELEKLVQAKPSVKGYDFNVVDTAPFVRATDKFVDGLANLWDNNLKGQKVTINRNGKSEVVTLVEKSAGDTYLYTVKDENDKETMFSVNSEDIISVDGQDISYLRSKMRNQMAKESTTLAKNAITKTQEAVKEDIKNNPDLAPIKAKVDTSSTAKQTPDATKSVPNISNVIDFVPPDDPLYETPIEGKLSFDLQGSNTMPFDSPKVFEVTSVFDKWLSELGNKLDISKPFNIKNIGNFGKQLVEQFRQEYLAKNNFTSIPKERIADFKKDWNAWLKDKFGLRHKEGYYGSISINGEIGELYGIENIVKNRKGGTIKGSEVIISGNFLLKDLPHEYQIGDQEGAGLGWYIYSEINGEPFIYEFQSDILPDLFGKSVSSTRKFKDANGNDSEVETLTSGEKRISSKGGTKYYSAIAYAYSFEDEAKLTEDGYKKIDEGRTDDGAYTIWDKQITKQEFEAKKEELTKRGVEEVLPSFLFDDVSIELKEEQKTKEILDLEEKIGKLRKEIIAIQTSAEGIKQHIYVQALTDEEAKSLGATEDTMEMSYQKAGYDFGRIEHTKGREGEFGTLNSEETLKAYPEMRGYQGFYIHAYNTSAIPETLELEDQIHKYLKEMRGIVKKILSKDNASVIPTLENLYKRYWNIWLIHSFIYAKQKGHNTIWLPTGEAMYEIEGSEKTAAMYATKWDLEKGGVESAFSKEVEAVTFDKVGPYWTALNKIKGIKLELAQPEWSTVPLIKADISQVDTEEGYRLFETPVEGNGATVKLPTAKDPLKVFVDGSDIKGTGQIGAGAFAEWNGEEFQLSITEESPEIQELRRLFPESNFSNPTMEMLGLLTTLKSLAETPGIHVEILQDYKGAINYGKLWNYSEGSEQRANKPWKPAESYIKYIVVQAEQEIDKIIAQGGSVKLTWTKGHAGRKGNEMADKLAKSRALINTFKSKEATSTNFQGYKGGFENTGKGTPQGDGKDKAMRKIADGFIGEAVKTDSSTYTSALEIQKKATTSKKVSDTIAVTPSQENIGGIIMLARNSEFRDKDLSEITKTSIRQALKNGSSFVVGDMPGVDSQFIDYLQEIGAKFTIYHTGETPRIKVGEATPTIKSSVKGINISSYESGLGRQLSNFAKMPIEFRGKKYDSSEAAYQANKKDLSDKAVLDLMIEVLEAKLKQYPNLSNQITQKGGIEFLKESTHNLIKDGKEVKADRWTGKGGLFMRALRKAYHNLSQTTAPSTTSKLQSAVSKLGKASPTVKFTTESASMISQGEVLSGFTGSTAGELIAYLKAQNIYDPQYKFIEELLTPILKDVVVKIEKVVDKFGNVKKAAWDNTTQVIYINPEFLINKSTKMYFTVLHEMTHAYLTSFIRSNTKEAKEFISKVRALMRTMQTLVASMEKNDSTAFDGSKELFQELKSLLSESRNLKQELAIYLSPLNSQALAAAEANGQTYYADVEEFLAGIFGGTTVFRDIAARTKYKVGYDTPSTSILQQFLKVISDLFKNLYTKVLGKSLSREKSDQSIINELETILHSYADPIESYWKPSKETTEKPLLLKKLREKELLDFSLDEDTKENYYDELSDMLDNMQASLDDEDVETRASTNSFIVNIVKTAKIKFPQLVKNISTMSYKEFNNYISKLDDGSGGNLSANIYNLWKTQGKKYEPKFEDYTKSFLVSIYNRLGNLTAKRTYNLITTRPKNISGWNEDFSYQYFPEIVVQPLGDEYKDTDGKRKSTFSERMPIETYIDSLGKILGLEPGELQLAFINGFSIEEQRYRYSQSDNDYHKVGLAKLLDKKNIKFLTKWDLGDYRDNPEVYDTDTISEFLAKTIGGKLDKINNRILVYIGSFGDKKTLPVISIPIDKAEKFVNILDKFREIYTAQIKSDNIHNFKETTDITGDQGATLRLMLEDLWYGVSPETFSDQNFKSIVAKLDFKALQKRATKWIHNDTKIVLEPELLGEDLISEIKAGKFSGISIDNKNNIVLRALIYDSKVTNTIIVDGKSYNLAKLLVNRRGTATTDGASFYILGQFDRIYRLVTGAIKKGAIKNVISSRMGEKALFIKHAMHALFTTDPLAKWMKGHNIAVLVSDEAAKVGVASYGKISLEQLAAPKSENDTDLEGKVINIPLQKFSRIKEEQSLDYMSGKGRQAINGTSIIDTNSVILDADPKGELVDSLVHLTNTLGKILAKRLKEYSTIQNIEEYLDKIAANPSSPKQQIAAKLLAPVLAIKDPLIKSIKLRSLVKHPIIAEILNKRYKDALDQSLQMVVPGYRAGLGPNIGDFAQSSQVDPVKDPNNIKNMLISLGANSDIFREALPDETLRTWIVELRNLQKQVSILLSKREDVTDLKNKITEKKEFIAKRLRQLASEEGIDENLAERYSSAAKGNFTNALSLEGPKAKKWSEKFSKEALDDNGLLKNGYVIITQDDAARHGLKVGDQVIVILTPTDAPTAISVQKIAAILPVFGEDAKSEKNKIILNSEYIQTVGGKDFDIDTVAVLAFDPEFWETKQWDNLLKTIYKITGPDELYAEHTIKTMRKVLGPGVSITKDNYTSDELRVKYAQAKLGARNKDSKTFAGLGKDFFVVNDAYQNEPSPIISYRLLHTLLSAIRIRANDVEIVTARFPNGDPKTIKKVTFDINHSGWIEAHVLHQIITHHMLDFPNNTSILEYNSNIKSDPRVKRKMFEYTWGLKDSKEYLGDEGIEAIDEFISVLFDKAIKLPQGKDPSTFNRATYFTQIQMVEEVKSIFEMLKSGDKIGLKDFYKNYLLNIQNEDSIKKGKTASVNLNAENKSKLPLVEAFIDKLDTNFLPAESKFRKGSAIFRYPLFSMINQLPKLVHTGFTQKENLSVDTITANAMVSMYPSLNKIYEDILSDSALRRWFTDRQTGKKYAEVVEEGLPNETSIAVSLIPWQLDFRKGRSATRPLSVLRKAAIAIIHGMNELEIEIREETKGNVLDPYLAQSRAKSFPVLFKALLNKDTLTYRGESRKITLQGKVPIELTVDKQGKLIVNVPNIGTYDSDFILNSPTKQGVRLRQLLIEEGGVWEDYNQRIALSNFLYFSDNLNLEERIEALRPYLWDQLYYKDFDRTDQLGFWISMMGHLSNAGIRDKNILGSNIGLTRMNPMKPYEYQSDTVLAQLLYEYERGLFNDYIYAYTEVASGVSQQNHLEVMAALQERPVDVNEVLYETEVSPSNDEDVIEKEMFLHIQNISKTIKSAKWKEFKKILHANYGLDDPKARKEKQIGEGLKALKQLLEGNSLLKALNETNGDLANILDDAIKYIDSPSKFAAKYRKTNVTRMYEIFGSHLEASNAGLSTRLDLYSHPALQQLYYLALEARDSLAESIGEKGLNTVPVVGGIFAFEGYALKHEHKNYAGIDRKTPVAFALGVDKLQPIELKLEDVETAQKLYPGTEPLNVGESSIAFLKKRQIDMALTTHSHLMLDQINAVEDVIERLTNESVRRKFITSNTELARSSASLKDEIDLYREIEDDFNKFGKKRLNKLKLRQLIFAKAENLYKRENVWINAIVSEDVKGNTIRTIRYNIRFAGKEYNYDNINDFLKNYTVLNKITSPYDKLILLGALQYRKMYDILAPNIIHVVLNYLNRSIEYLSKSQGVTEGVLQLIAIRERYSQYQEATRKRSGNYMPHSYPVEEFKLAWYSHYQEVVRNNILNQIEINKERRRQDNINRDLADKGVLKRTPIHYNSVIADMDPNTINAHVVERLNAKWKNIEVGISSTSYIPNFLERKIMDDTVEYDTISMHPHQAYVRNLMKGVRQDLMTSDYFSYLERARFTGERLNVIEATKKWFADQSSSKILHTRPIPISKLKEGMEINFSLPRRLITGLQGELSIDEVQVWGILKEVKNGKIKLAIDKETILKEIITMLEQNEAQSDAISLNFNLGEDDPVTEQQLGWIFNLTKRGLITIPDPEKILNLKALEANKFISDALRATIANPDSIGTYDIEEIYRRDLSGNKVSKEANRYIKRGSVERLQAKQRESRNRLMMLSEPSMTSNLNYQLWKTTASLYKSTIVGLIRIRAIAFLGFAVAGRAMSTNGLGGMFSKLNDSPRKSISLLRRGMREWGRIKHGHLETMPPSDRKLFSVLKSLNLTSTSSLMKISLEDIGSDIESDITETGAIKKVIELINTFKDASNYRKYVDSLEALRLRMLQAMAKNDDAGVEKFNREILLLKGKWKALINHYIKDIDDITEQAAIAGIVKYNKTPLEDRVPNLAEARGITARMALWKLAKLIPDDLIYQNYLGVKLQGLAEVLRRPTFFIGYLRAQDLNYTPDEQIMYGLNNVWFRDAFYGKSNKQYGANTIAGPLFYQFSQYVTNAFRQYFRAWHQSKVQSLAKTDLKNKEWIAQRFNSVYTTVEEQLKYENKSDRKEEFNSKRALIVKTIMGMMLMEVGNRAIWGLVNAQDPVIQSVYGLMDFILKTAYPDTDKPEEDLMEDIYYALTDILFFMGAGNATMLHIALSGPKKGLLEGRPEQQVREATKLYNTVEYLIAGKDFDAEGNDKVMNGNEIDNMLLSLELWGYTNPNDEELYIDDYNFIWGDKERRIKPSEQDYEAIQDEGEGIGFKQRIHMLAQPRTYIPLYNRIDKIIKF